ncbi:MAG: PAS domain-containing protein [Paracoccaceae bacterium]
MKSGGGAFLSAFDRNRRASPGDEALLLAAALSIADIATSGIQKALERLATAFVAPLGLIIADVHWQTGVVRQAGIVRHDGARLHGLPETRSQAVDDALGAVLRAAVVHQSGQAVCRAREAAATDFLFEVTSDGCDAGWCSAGAEALFNRLPAARADLEPAVVQAMSDPSGAGVSATTEFAGRTHSFRVTAHPSGTEGRWLIRLVDRTEADRARAKIDHRDQLLRRLFDLSPVGVVLIDFESREIQEANTAFIGFGRWARDALIGVPIDSLLSPDQIEVIERARLDLLEHGRFGPYEQTLLRPDGTGFPAVLRGLQLTGGDGAQIIWVLVEDVSEQRRHLDEMQSVRDEAVRARAELRTAVQALPHGFVLFDAEDRVVMVNDQMAAVCPNLAREMVPGRTYEQVLRSGVASGTFPEAVGREQEFVADILRNRRQPVFERITELANGRVMRVLERATPSGGRVGLRIDVTAERDSEQRLSQVIEGSQAGTWEADFTTGENRVNERWAQMLGWSLAELEPVTLATWQGLMHPDDLEPSLATVARVLNREEDFFDFTFRLRHRDAHWVWVQSRGHVSVRDAHGMPVRMSGVHVDVSALKAAEQRLEQIIEGAEAGTWHRNIRTGVSHVNDLWVGMLGYTTDELCPVTDAVWTGLLHPEDATRLSQAMAMRFASGESQFQDELRLRHKDGHWVWVLSRGRVTERDEAGRPVSLSGVHLDISARKRLEGDLEVERDFLFTMMETSISGILAVDANARMVFFNREIQRIFELPDEALLNEVCDPVALGLSDLDGEPLHFDNLPWQLALARGQFIRDMRLRMAMQDGRVKVVSVNAAVLPDPGMVARVVCTVTDVTATALAEDALRAAMDRAEAANRAKSQFLANMSHELRTPLNGVLGMVDLLAEGAPDAAQRCMLDTIRESGMHLLSIVNDLLDIAKIESGKLDLVLAPIRLADLATRIEAMHGLAARRKGVSLRIGFGPGADRMRLGDPKRLLQILHNLVGNAVKFTEAGSVEVEVHEDPKAGDRVIIVVADTGIGMSDDQTALVFEEFTQGDGSITRRFGGTGLGLPIVRRLVELMDGEIVLLSAPGRGTTVTVTLPMAACAVPDTVMPQVPSVPLFRGQRALLAEDNATNRMILRAMLTRLGYRVTLAEDGDEAVAEWAPDRFDLVLLDISMPLKDGLTALQELVRKADGAPLPPVLAVTANAMAHHLQEYREAGFSEVVTKPVTLEVLAEAILRAQHHFVAVPDPRAITRQ